MSKKQKEAGLGKALKNKLEKKRYVGGGEKAPIFFQQTEENQADKKKQRMQSVVQQNSLTEFLQVAQMSQQDFHANRNIKFRDIREELSTKKILSNNKAAKQAKIYCDSDLLNGIQLPRRPQWQQSTSKQQLQRLQNQAYLTWRRKLAQVEQTNQDISITPYEKNLQVWRQLWRVVQRCDVLAQIVDGRNPLFFYSEDLVTYSRERGCKRFLVIINKSDLVSQEARQAWNAYFIEKGIDHCFFAAKEEAWVQGEGTVSPNTPSVLSPLQLVQLMKGLIQVQGKVEIGLTGYPNVGKSSVINAVLGKKKVGVASMPGKTKHFQTLKLTEEVTLCDCPGLVFPKVSQSKAEMVLCGLYSIDTLKEFIDPMDLIAFRVKKQVLEKHYCIQWKENQPYDGESILVKYAKLKGFYTGNALPNECAASRVILKDYINGVIIYNHLPSTKQQAAFEQKQAEIQLQKMNFAKKQEHVEQNLDDDFFHKQERVERTTQEMIKSLGEEDLIDIVEGRKPCGLKITKDMRKEIKFALKRGAKLEDIKKIILNTSPAEHKLLIKV